MKSKKFWGLLNGCYWRQEEGFALKCLQVRDLGGLENGALEILEMNGADVGP